MNVLLSKTFFPQHPKAGEQTGFKEKVQKGEKRHTCRCNYDYWKEGIDSLQKRGGVLSLRQWSGKPYQKNTTQERIMDIPASIVDVQKLVMRRNLAKEGGYDYSAQVEGTPVQVSQLAKNDGLTLEDFKAWFNPVFDENKADALTFAVIHFTTFRY